MRWIRLTRSTQGLFITDFMVDEQSRHSVTSYTWIPSDDVVADWLDQGKHPKFIHA